MRSLLLITASLAVSACNSPQATSPVDEAGVIKAKWNKLPDGSVGWTDAMSDMKVAERCWKDGSRFQCVMISEPISLNEMSVATQMLAYGYHRDTLSERWIVPEHGYRCNYTTAAYSTTSETIELPTGAKLNNPINRTPWTAEFVHKFAAENSPKADIVYFSCAALDRFLRRANPEALLTTAISAKELELAL